MSPIQKLVTLAMIAGVFILATKLVDPLDLLEWAEVLFFGCVGAVAILLVLNRAFGYAAADFSPKLAFLDDTKLFSSSAPKRQNSETMQTESKPEHYILQRKNSGTSDELAGDVLITFILVDDPKSVWSDEDFALFHSKTPAEAQFLESEAARYGVDLSIRVQYIKSKVDIEKPVDWSEDDAWRDAALKAAGLPNTEKVSDYLKEACGADQAPVFFCVCRDGRSYAPRSNDKIPFEYGILYREAGDYAHELCHQFGAMDYYYPEEVKQLAQEVFPNSIMLTSVNRSIDDLSAYVMGWTDELSPAARYFVENTNWVTPEVLSAAHKKQAFTGKGTIENEYFTYTGDLVAGIPDGYGIGHYQSGVVYEGEYSYGKVHGYGTATYPNGNVYTGEWYEEKRHGQGTLTYPSGYQQKGKWNMDVFIG